MVSLLCLRSPRESTHMAAIWKTICKGILDTKSLVTSTNTTNTHINRGGTPRLKYQVPKLNTHAWAALLRTLCLLLLPTRDCCHTTHYQLAACALVNSTLAQECWTHLNPYITTTACEGRSRQLARRRERNLHLASGLLAHHSDPV